MRSVAVLGAASTGKTSLVLNMARALREQGDTVELLAASLDGLAANSGAAGTRRADWLLADVSLPLNNPAHWPAPQLATPAAQPPQGTSPKSRLTPAQEKHLTRFDGLLLTGLDLGQSLPLNAADTAATVGTAGDGLATAVSPQLRMAQDAWLRAALSAAHLRFQVVYGRGDLRWQQALAALGRPLLEHVDQRVPGQGEWLCERCSDPDCERRLFGRLFGSPLPSTH